jgi:hypothetical protein
MLVIHRHCVPFAMQPVHVRCSQGMLLIHASVHPTSTPAEELTTPAVLCVLRGQACWHS